MQPRNRTKRSALSGSVRPRRRPSTSRRPNFEALEGRALLSVAGDFNRDGFADLAIGAPGENSQAGAVNILYSSGLRLATTGAEVWTQDNTGQGRSEKGDRFGAGLASGGSGSPTIPKSQADAEPEPSNRDYELTPERRAFLDTISYAEGTYDKPRHGYFTYIGGSQFRGTRSHPHLTGEKPIIANSTAAGRYQILDNVYRSLHEANIMDDFTPSEQDDGALYLIDAKREALKDVDAAGSRHRFEAAVHKLAPEWASLPNENGDSEYDQPVKDIDDLYRFFRERLERYDNDDSDTAPATGQPERLAERILDHRRITLETQHDSGVQDDATARQNIADTAAGRPARRSNYGTAPGGSVRLDARVLEAMLELAKQFSFRVTEIAGASHTTSNSRHYDGLAFDVGTINGDRTVNGSDPDIQEFLRRAKALGAEDAIFEGGNHVHVEWSPRR
jgi:muramidase (phage lysozyme)